MSRIPAFLLAILWMMTPWASAYAYEFPIENRWKATVVGTPPGYRAELPKKIPLKKRRIEILDREVPEALWHDQELRYSYALQRDPAPLVFLIAGTGASCDGGKNTNMGKANRLAPCLNKFIQRVRQYEVQDR